MSIASSTDHECDAAPSVQLAVEKIMKVLLAGESWHTHSIHIKGFDSFETSSYHEGAGEVINALEAVSIDVDYLPNHAASDLFPASAAAMAVYSTIILSDIGANTL